MKNHESVRIILINQDQELLLMCGDDPKITNKDGSYFGRFWFLVGGHIEHGESVMDTAIRELKEETGLNKDEVTFGPEVWHGEFEMVYEGKLTKMKQQFVVANTNNRSVTLEYLTPSEQKIIEKVDWFSLNDICNSKEVIYPATLKDHLPDILEKKYPKEPIWIDLAKKPSKITL